MKSKFLVPVFCMFLVGCNREMETSLVKGKVLSTDIEIYEKYENIENPVTKEYEDMNVVYSKCHLEIEYNGGEILNYTNNSNTYLCRLLNKGDEVTLVFDNDVLEKIKEDWY